MPPKVSSIRHTVPTTSSGGQKGGGAAKAPAKQNVKDLKRPGQG